MTLVQIGVRGLLDSPGEQFAASAVVVLAFLAAAGIVYACGGLLKGRLSDEAAESLVRRLGACEQPYACPHGRPTVLSIGEETLARGFERGNTRLG